MKNSIIVTRESGERFPNLTGVFRRRFPVVVGQVKHSGKPQAVTYYGERYIVSTSEGR